MASNISNIALLIFGIASILLFIVNERSEITGAGKRIERILSIIIFVVAVILLLN